MLRGEIRRRSELRPPFDACRDYRSFGLIIRRRMLPGGVTVPMYEYECQACHHRFERIQQFSDPLVKKCPKCGKKKDTEDKGQDKSQDKRSEEHTSELQSLAYLVCRLLLEKKKKTSK